MAGSLIPPPTAGLTFAQLAIGERFLLAGDEPNPESRDLHVLYRVKVNDQQYDAHWSDGAKTVNLPLPQGKHTLVRRVR